MPFMNRTQTVTTQFAKHFSFRFGSHKTGKLSFLPMVSHASKGTRKVTTMYFMLSRGVQSSRIKVFIYTLKDKSKCWELIDECPLVKTRDDVDEINRHMVEFDSNNHGGGDLPWFRLDIKMEDIQESIFYFGKVNHGNRFVRSKKYLTTLLGKDTILDDSLTMDKIHQKFLSFTTQDSSVSTIMDDHGPSPSPQSPPLLNLPTYVTYNPFAVPMYCYPQTAFGYHSMDVMMGQHAHLLNAVQSMNQTQAMCWIDPTTQGSTIGTNSVNFAMNLAVDQHAHQSTVPATSIDSTDNFWDLDSLFQSEPNNFPIVVDVSHEPELSHTGDDQSIGQKRKLSCFAEEEDDLFPPAKFMTFDDEEEPALNLFDFEGHKLW